MSEKDHAPITIVEKSTPMRRLHPMVEMFQKQDGAIDTQTMREMMQIQREFQADEAKRSYTLARIALDAEIPRLIRKTASASFGEGQKAAFKYATLDNILDTIMPILNQHGFTLTHFSPPSTGSDVVVTCRLEHSDGHSQESTMRGPPDTKGSKSGAQAVASTFTLFRRHTIMGLLNIATADMEPPRTEQDPDGVIDTARNQAAFRKLSEQGKLEAAQTFLGKPWEKWTSADFDRLNSRGKP